MRSERHAYIGTQLIFSISTWFTRKYFEIKLQKKKNTHIEVTKSYVFQLYLCSHWMIGSQSVQTKCAVFCICYDWNIFGRYSFKQLMWMVSLSVVSLLRSFMKPVFKLSESSKIPYGIPIASISVNFRWSAVFSIKWPSFASKIDILDRWSSIETYFASCLRSSDVEPSVKNMWLFENSDSTLIPLDKRYRVAISYLDISYRQYTDMEQFSDVNTFPQNPLHQCYPKWSLKILNTF